MAFMFITNKKFDTAIYLRLSREDGDKMESDSIQNQRVLLKDYINDHPDLNYAAEFLDDGYSGVDFERPGFNKMMDAVRDNKCNCIIVKDLSRLGRNYIEVGKYLENIFPFMGVRFIAVNDNFDSEDIKNDSNQIIVPFKNLINDAYCRDISIKIRSQLDVKRKSGKFVGSFASYGYMKDPDDKNHLIIDDYAADIVQNIFKLKLEGMNSLQIANHLNNKGVLPPAEYKQSCGLNFMGGLRRSSDPKWHVPTVNKILTNEMYLGTMVQGKVQKVNYKVKDYKQIEKEKWIRVEGTHEPIIDRNVFETVQKLLSKDTRCSPGEEYVMPFSGMLVCGSCGDSYLHRSVTSCNRKYFYYRCVNFKDKSCSGKEISEKTLKETVLNAINNHIQIIASIEEILKDVEELPKDTRRIKAVTRQINKLTSDVTRYEDLQEKLLLDLHNGIVEQDEYKTLKNRFTNKIEIALSSKKELLEEKERLLDQHYELPGWMEDIKQFAGIKELDRKTVVFLIDHITVHDKDHIEIHFNHEDEFQEIIDRINLMEKQTRVQKEAAGEI